MAAIMILTAGRAGEGAGERRERERGNSESSAIKSIVYSMPTGTVGLPITGTWI